MKFLDDFKENYIYDLNQKGHSIIHNNYIYVYSTFDKPGNYKYGSVYGFSNDICFTDRVTVETVIRSKDGVHWEEVYYNELPLYYRSSHPESYVFDDYKKAAFLEVDGKIYLLTADKLLISEDGLNWKEDKNHPLVNFVNMKTHLSDEYMDSVYKTSKKKQYHTFANAYIPDIYYYNGYYFISDIDMEVTPKLNHNRDEVYLSNYRLLITKDFVNYLEFPYDQSSKNEFLCAKDNIVISQKYIFDTDLIDNAFENFDELYIEKITE